MFGPDYVTLASTAKCYHSLRITEDRHIIPDIEHIAMRVGMAKWIPNYISPQVDEAPYIEGSAMIKNGILILEARFWLFLIH